MEVRLLSPALTRPRRAAFFVSCGRVLADGVLAPSPVADGGGVPTSRGGGGPSLLRVRRCRVFEAEEGLRPALWCISRARRIVMLIRCGAVGAIVRDAAYKRAAWCFGRLCFHLCGAPMRLSALSFR